MLSNYYQSIQLFRYDDSRKIVYIIAEPTTNLKSLFHLAEVGNLMKPDFNVSR